MTKLYCRTCKDYVDIGKEQRIPAVGKGANRIRDTCPKCKKKINSFVGLDWTVAKHDESEWETIRAKRERATLQRNAKKLGLMIYEEQKFLDCALKCLDEKDERATAKKTKRRRQVNIAF
ncbi:unnamed protein product [Rhizophagus irregularis]|nr:unnamed protein product [Rhizophagus irregularis]